MNEFTASLAQVDYTMRLKGMQRAFQPNQLDPQEFFQILVFLAVVFALVISILAGRMIWRHKTGKLASGRPAKLFTHVLKQLGVRLPDRILLRIAAANSGLRQPTLMLFSPELYERYAGRWADAIAIRPLREHIRKRINALGEEAFASGEDRD